MRLPLVLTLSLAAVPLGAQASRIAPAPSLLFARSNSSDTTTSHPRISVAQGAELGTLAGIGIGVAFGAYMAANHPCSCDDPGLERLTYGFLGGVIGMVVGGSFADEARQKARERERGEPASIRPPDDASIVTGDSTRLIGTDRHGIRGGVAGALVGGLAGFATPHLIYAVRNSRGVDLSSGGTGHGPSTLALGLSTVTGAVSGYLIAAALSRR